MRKIQSSEIINRNQSPYQESEQGNKDSKIDRLTKTTSSSTFRYVFGDKFDNSNKDLYGKQHYPDVTNVSGSSSQHMNEHNIGSISFPNDLARDDVHVEELRSREPIFNDVLPFDTDTPEIIELDADDSICYDNEVDYIEYWDIGDPVHRCEFCGAKFWFDERLKTTRKELVPKFSLCCMQGKIQLPLMPQPPLLLQDLIWGQSDRSKHFLDNIRSFNNMFSFTSLGGTIDRNLNRGNSPPVFRMHGQNYHRLGSLLPSGRAPPAYAQLYIYDTNNEIYNRILSVRSPENINTIQAEIVSDLKEMLDNNNVLVQRFRTARDKFSSGHRNVTMQLIGSRGYDARTHNLPTVSEVAAVFTGDLDSTIGVRDIIIEAYSGTLQRITELNPSYLALQYPLLFPYGEDGYREDIPFSQSALGRVGQRTGISIREFFAYRLQERNEEPPTLLSCKRLTQQFIVDAYTMVESARLLYIKNHQKELRCDMYAGLEDAYLNGEMEGRAIGKRIVLPPSFTGGPRYMMQNYQDAMAICRWAGYPQLFITFTCNTKWPEIVRYMSHRGQNPEDRPDIVCRIFKVKLDALIRDIRQNKIFGNTKAVLYTVEFQKRGLPHAHILVFLEKYNEAPSGDDIDRIISAELPDEANDKQYFEAVRDFMMHGPCGPTVKYSPCYSDEGECTKHFPKKFSSETSFDDDGYPIYRRRDDGKTVKKKDIFLDNRFVVPHNRYLLLKYGAHINVEWCNQSRAIKYLFKYINKGHDRVTATFVENNGDSNHASVVDEIKMYYDCRYISPCEAAWRLFGFEINYRYPSVERLAFHLPDQQNVVFRDADSLHSVLDRPSVKTSMFLAWFDLNKHCDAAAQLTYAQIPQFFIFKRKTRTWEPRQRGFSVGRISYVPPGTGEAYYLRILLNVVTGPKCFDDIKKFRGTVYPTFRDACYARGLLDDDREYVDGLEQASVWASASSMRSLFVTLLNSGSLNNPCEIWDKCWKYLSDDILYKRRKIMRYPELRMSDDEIKNCCLLEIDNMLRSLGKSLHDFDGMPVAVADSSIASRNRLILTELSYNRADLREEHEVLLRSLNDEQRVVFDKINSSLSSDLGGVFFVYGYGGTGKTFLWRTLSAGLRSEGEIVLNVASSGIASLLLPGGRTTHSRFCIPINCLEDSTCNINQGSNLAELLIKCKLIIWDEAPMIHRHCIEALDTSLRDIMQLSDPSRSEIPFGGKTIVFGGDFRQILPVIPKGRRQDIVHATINSSDLWNACTVLKLTRNMRLMQFDSVQGMNEMKLFSEWIESVGDGSLGTKTDYGSDIIIPDDILLKCGDDPIASIVDCIYPDFKSRMYDHEFLQDRAILAPTLDAVKAINDYMVQLNQKESRKYLSSDSLCRSDSNFDSLDHVHTPEFLNTLKFSGVPDHELNLKVGTPVMLLRNIDHSRGLCNGTRLVITRLSDRVIEAKVLTGSSAGELALIPRLSLTPSDTRLPFKFTRRQFPLIVSYAMSINKSQGQSFSHVGVFLKKTVFSHGQLYVAVSRVTSRRGLRIMLCNNNSSEHNTTKNVVFQEVFRNV